MCFVQSIHSEGWIVPHTGNLQGHITHLRVANTKTSLTTQYVHKPTPLYVRGCFAVCKSTNRNPLHDTAHIYNFDPFIFIRPIITGRYRAVSVPPTICTDCVVRHALPPCTARVGAYTDPIDNATDLENPYEPLQHFPLRYRPYPHRAGRCGPSRSAQRRCIGGHVITVQQLRIYRTEYKPAACGRIAWTGKAWAIACPAGRVLAYTHQYPSRELLEDVCFALNEFLTPA